MVELNKATEVYQNEDGFPVIQDPKHPSIWRRVNADGETATKFAKPPPRGAKPIQKPGTISIIPGEQLPPVIERIEESMHQLVEQLGHTEELEQAKAKVLELEAEVERLNRLSVEKDTTISDLTDSKARGLREKDETIAARDKTIRGLNDQIQNAPNVDVGEIDRLKQQIAKDTRDHGDEIKAKDDQIAGLTEDLRKANETKDKAVRDANAAPPAHRAAFYRRWYQRSPRWTLGGGAVVAALLLLLLFGGVRYWFGGHVLPVNVAALQQQVNDLERERNNANAAKSTVESERNAAKSAQTTAEARQRDAETRASAAEAKAKAATDSLDKANQEAAVAKAAQKKAEDELAEVKKQKLVPTPTPSPTMAQPPPAPSVVPDSNDIDALLEKYRRLQESGRPLIPCVVDGVNGWCRKRY